MRQVLLLLLAASIAAAQPAPKDRAGCQDTKLLTRFPGCSIQRCETRGYATADLVVARGSKKNHVEGAYELIRYTCPTTVSAVELMRNAEGAFRKAGYTIHFTDTYGPGTRAWVTAQNGPQWAHVYSENGMYELTAVKTKELEQAMKATADAWNEQINQTGRVSIYGINFVTGKATIRPDSEPVLKEVLALLQKQPDWYLVVAGHTDTVGSDATNIPLSRLRAESVVAWLAAQGIDKARLTPAGFGAKKPVADNATEEGRAKNRRVDLVKLY